MNSLTTTLVSLIAIAGAATAHAAGYNFDSNAQGWYRSGFFDGGTINPVPGHHATTTVQWHVIDGDGAIALAYGGNYAPQGPSGNSFVHDDFVSPELTQDWQWQNAWSFSYEINGAAMPWATQIWVQAVVHVRTDIGTETFFTDGQFHQVATDQNAGWQRYSVSLTALEIPDTWTIKRIYLRVFYLTGSWLEGEVAVDNVEPYGLWSLQTIKPVYKTPYPYPRW